MQEIRVRILGWEDPLEKEMATHSSTLAWKIPWTEEPGSYSPLGCKESDTTEWLPSLFFSWWISLKFNQFVYPLKELCCGMDPLYRSHSVQSATDWLFHPSPTASDAPPLFQLISLLVRGLPGCGNLSSSSTPLQGTQVPSVLSSSFSLILPLIIPGYVASFLSFPVSRVFY